jgi:hypothetical protein
MLTITQARQDRYAFAAVLVKVFESDIELHMDEFMTLVEAAMCQRGIEWTTTGNAWDAAEFRENTMGDSSAIVALRTEKNDVREAFANFINHKAFNAHVMDSALLIFTTINKIIR